MYDVLFALFGLIKYQTPLVLFKPKYPQFHSVPLFRLAVPSPEGALKLLAMAEARASGMISAFEIIHRQGLEFLAEHMPEVGVPLQPLPEWSVLVELGLPAGFENAEALMAGLLIPMIPSSKLPRAAQSGISHGLRSWANQNR